MRESAEVMKHGLEVPFYVVCCACYFKIYGSNFSPENVNLLCVYYAMVNAWSFNCPLIVHKPGLVLSNATR